ncbi:MAG: tetratricopeptide repeat protein [Kiritimatiellia bacterium]
MSGTIIRSVPLGVLILGFVSATLLGADSAEESAAERARRAAYVLEKAEEARAAGKNIEATILYKDALARYSSLAEKYPEWEPEVVRLRLVYCNEQLQGLLEPKKRANEGPQSLPQASPVLEKTPPVPKHELHESTDPRVKRIVALVKQLIISGATEEARTKLIEGLRIDPDNAALRLLIGIVQCRAGNYADAAYVLETLLEEQPQNAPAHVALGVAYAGLGRTADAERQNLTALELNPRLAEACYNLTRLLLLKEPPNLQSAHRYYLKALELGAQPDEEVEEALELFFSSVEGSARP